MFVFVWLLGFICMGCVLNFRLLALFWFGLNVFVVSFAGLVFVWFICLLSVFAYCYWLVMITFSWFMYGYLALIACLFYFDWLLYNLVYCLFWGGVCWLCFVFNICLFYVCLDCVWFGLLVGCLGGFDVFVVLIWLVWACVSCELVYFVLLVCGFEFSFLGLIEWIWRFRFGFGLFGFVRVLIVFKNGLC